MISRSNMRRQLQANGGIMNARQGYGIGSFVKEKIRKLIPNELADIAVKAAPFVAMIPGYGPLAAGVMRGVGRFDQRGSVSDALKQGIGTYAGGKLFNKGMTSAGFREKGASGLGEFFNQGAKDSVSGTFNTGKEKLKGLMTPGTEAGKILKNQLIIGGGTALVSLISQGLIDEPEQEEGEDINAFMARRKISVSKQLKTYLGNTNKFRGMSEEELDTLVAQNMTEYDKDFVSGSGGYNQGGRVGLANGSGGITMANSLAQNIAQNRANQAAILQQQQSDMLQAQNIFTQMGAEARKSQMQRWQINSELQTKIHEITAKVTVNKAKMADKAMNAITQYISS